MIAGLVVLVAVALTGAASSIIDEVVQGGTYGSNNKKNPSKNRRDSVIRSIDGKAFPNIDYQIHSNNDLRELPQLLLKGARRFKFDPHYVANASACDGKSECLLLNHDTPVPSIGTYSTSDELLNFLMSPEFEKSTNGEYVSVALCFKSAPDRCQNTTKFSSWLALADDFFAKAALLPAGVEIILDGDAKPKDCLLGRWQPFKSVWIQGDSPNSAFEGDEGELDEYRYQILNNRENISNWKWMATPEINYGKFSSGSYPYQLWEVIILGVLKSHCSVNNNKFLQPDSQEDYQEYMSIYRSGHPHDQGYHFAINTDMVCIQRNYSEMLAYLFHA
jgi:hypothetical protein